MKKKPNYLAKAIMLSLALGVSASVALPQSAWADSITTTEYLGLGNGGNVGKYSPLDLLNVKSAYDAGYTGKGVTVGMCDDGLDATHKEFSSKSNTPVGLPIGWTGTAEEWFVYYDNIHGTHVAGIIAASKNGSGMHGVAYDANVIPIVDAELDPETGKPNYNFIATPEAAKDVEAYWSSDDIKVTNNSWGADIDAVADVSSNKASDGARATDQYWSKYAQPWQDSAGNTHEGKLFFFASGNDGTFGPSVDSFAYLYDKKASNNIITVGSLSKYAVRDGNGKITVASNESGTNKADLLAEFSCLALGNEEKFVLGTGEAIYSVKAGTTNEYLPMDGTSMATPSVTGVAALVQQAFPYLTGKQIGDVILATANKNLTFKDGIQVTINENYDQVNIFLVGKDTTIDEAGIQEAVKSLKAKDGAKVRVFSNVNVESLIGQGVVDAGKAVQGLATLNARRLTNADFSADYTVKGEQANQAIYTVNTQGYNSTWSNDISEVRVGKLATDSSQEDLKQRATYYTTGTYDSYTYSKDANTLTNKTTNTLTGDNSDYKEYLNYLQQYYNEDLQELQGKLLDLHVGLKKTGEGTLTLSGNNTYEGATIVNEGTLNINGSITGDAYSEGSGLLSGAGTIQGNAYNSGKIGALTPTTQNTKLTINGNLDLGTGSSVQVTGNQKLVGYVNVLGNVDKDANVKLTLDPNAGFLPGNSYSVLKQNETDVVLSKVDANVGTQGLLQATYNKAGNVDFAFNSNNGILNAEQNQAVQAVDAARISNPTQYAGLSAAEQDRYATFLNSPDNSLIRKVAGELTSNANTQAAQAVQQGNLVGRMVRARMANVNHAKVSVPVQVTPKSLTTNKAAEQQTITTQITVPVEPENSFWAKVDKSWGTAGSMNMHSAGLTFGYDKQYNDSSRAGVLFSYGDSSVGGAQKSDKLKDYRLGFYHNYHQGADDVTVYLDYGQQRHDAKRYTYLQSSKNAYDSNILELGAEYKHDLHAQDGKIFHVAPYINAQASRYWQNGYNEGMLSQKVNTYNGNYLATGLGVEVSRYFAQGSYSARLGYKEVWDGASTTMNYNLGSVGFVAKSDLDKHFVTASLGGNAKLNKHGWSLEGDAHIEKGAHDKNYGVSATLKLEW